MVEARRSLGFSHENAGQSNPEPVVRGFAGLTRSERRLGIQQA